MSADTKNCDAFSYFQQQQLLASLAGMTVPAQQQSSASITGLTPGKSTLERYQSIERRNESCGRGSASFGKLDPDPHQRENVGPGVQISIKVKSQEMWKLKNWSNLGP
jgi:hypothetical protein